MRTSEPRRADSRAKSSLIAALLVFLPMLSACTATAVRVPQPTPTGAAPTLRRVLDILDARDKALSRFRAQARLDFKSPEQSFRSTQVVVVRAPSSARIDVMNPFGVSYTVATDGKLISAYDRRQSVFYTGHAQPDSFRHFTGIPMQASELSSVLRGLPPNLGESRWGPIEATEGGWLLKRRLPAGGTLQLVLQANSLIPLTVKISGDRERHDVEISYEDYRDVGGVFVPHRIQATFKGGAHLDLVYKSVQRDAVLSDDAFHLERPPGARFVNIDSGAGGGGA